MEVRRAAYLSEMEKVEAESKSLIKELSEEGCEQCVYTKGEVTLQNIIGWSEVSIAYQYYICHFPIYFQIMKVMEWTYGVAFDGFSPKECVLKETKANYDQFFDEYGEMKFFMNLKYGKEGPFLKQAKAQNAVALEGMPPGRLEWYFMQPISYAHAKKIFLMNGFKIDVFHKSMPSNFITEIFPEFK